MPLDWVFSSSLNDSADPSSEGRFRAVFQSGDRPTALVCASDSRAAEAMRLLGALGLRCPADVAIVGLGDREFAPFLPVPLTTFRFDLVRLGDAVVSATRRLLAGQAVQTERIGGELVVRQSSGATTPRVR